MHLILALKWTVSLRTTERSLLGLRISDKKFDLRAVDCRSLNILPRPRYLLQACFRGCDIGLVYIDYRNRKPSSFTTLTKTNDCGATYTHEVTTFNGFKKQLIY